MSLSSEAKKKGWIDPNYTPVSENVPSESWIEIAKKDPMIKAWWNELSSNHKDVGTNMIAHMTQNILDKRNRGYDYATAITNGVRPAIDPESGELHWKDIAAGVLLKGKNHPTVQYGIDEMPFKKALQWARDNKVPIFKHRGKAYKSYSSE